MSLGLSYNGGINAYDKWLASGKEDDMMRFKVARNKARKSIRDAKNSEPRQGRQKASIFGGRRCGSAIEICSFEEEVEFLLEWVPSMMRVRNIAAH